MDKMNEQNGFQAITEDWVARDHIAQLINDKAEEIAQVAIDNDIDYENDTESMLSIINDIIDLNENGFSLDEVNMALNSVSVMAALLILENEGKVVRLPDHRWIATEHVENYKKDRPNDLP
jgi:hypothetical protein